MPNNILGIDLGTTNTSASLILENQQPIPVPLSRAADPFVMRSAALKLPDRWLAGDEAREYTLQNERESDRLMTAFKPLLMLPERGRTRWKAISVEGEYRDDPTFMGTVQVGGGTKYVLAAESYTSTLCPPGMTLSDVRGATQAMLEAVQRKVKEQQPRLALQHMVVGIPVGFPDTGKAKLLDAAMDAGIVSNRRQIALFPEPIAVALAYGVEYRTPKRVLVFDHGGGTLDLTIIDIEGHPNGDFRYQVLAQEGHDRAGRYYDRLLLARILELSPNGKAAVAAARVKDPMEISQARFIDEAARVKEALFPKGTRRLMRKPRFTQQFETVHVSVEVSEDLFHDVIREELAAIREKLRSVIAQAEARGVPIRGRGLAGVQEVLMAGGSASIPAMRRLVEEIFPGVPINAEYAGSRTTTSGFARAVQYRKLIDELTDTEYSFYEPQAGKPFPVLKMGTPLVDTTKEAQLGSQKGFYMKPETDKATVLTFATVHEQHRMVLQSEVQARPGETVQLMVTVDRETGRPQVEAVSCETRQPLKVHSIPAGAPGAVPLLEPGQVVRFSHNQYPSGRSGGAGCIEKVVRIGDGNSVPVALGDMMEYRLVMHHPNGVIRQVRAETLHLEVFEVGLPRPGQMIELDTLPDRQFTRLVPVPIHAFQLAERPANFEAAAKAPQPQRGVESEALPSAVPEQVTVVEAPAPRRRQTIGNKLLEYLKGNLG